MRVWRGDIAFAPIDAGPFYPADNAQPVKGVEAYRTIDDAAYATLRDVTTGLAQTAAQQLGATFVPTQAEHSHHVHVFATYDFGVGRQLEPLTHFEDFELVASLGTGMPAESRRQHMVVYLAGLLLQQKEASLSISYTFGSRDLARESFTAAQLCDAGFFAQPSVAAGELQSPSKSISSQFLKDTVQATFNKDYAGLMDRAVDLGYLDIRQF